MRHSGCRAGLLLAACTMAMAAEARAGESVRYRYDSLGRLVRVERSGSVNNGLNANYAYDCADNRSRMVSGPGAAPAPPPPCPPPPPPPPPPGGGM